MSYRVALRDPKVKETIQSWNLSRQLLVRIQDKLVNELARDPLAHLQGPIVPYADLYGYYFVLEDRTRLPHLHHFAFFVRIQGEELLIDGCRHTTEDPGTN